MHAQEAGRITELTSGNLGLKTSESIAMEHCLSKSQRRANSKRSTKARNKAENNQGPDSQTNKELTRGEKVARMKNISEREKAFLDWSSLHETLGGV